MYIHFDNRGQERVSAIERKKYYFEYRTVEFRLGDLGRLNDRSDMSELGLDNIFLQIIREL